MDPRFSATMSSETVSGEEDARQAALTNQLVLRCIFSHLELSDLNQCRLVNRFWEFEVGFYIRENRRCFAKTPNCRDLIALNGIVSQMMTFTPIINGLSIILCDEDEPHARCPVRDQEFLEIFRNLPLKHVEIFRNITRLPNVCPTIEFAISVIREKLIDMETLTLDQFPGICKRYFGEDWNPVLPKMKILDLGKIHEFEVLPIEESFLAKILNAAPNLEKLKGSQIKTKFLNRIPQGIWALLDSFELTIGSEEDEKYCLKLAEARPALSRLSVSAPLDSDERMGSFLRVTEELLTSSSKTLKEFEMNHVNFPFSFLNFAPLVNLKKLTISTQFQSEQQYQQCTSRQLLAVLRSIDYHVSAPYLTAVYIHAEEVISIPEERVNPWVNIDEPALVETRAATRVQRLEVTGDFQHLTFQDLCQMFPNVINLKASTLQSLAIPYKDLWASWPDLKVVHLLEEEHALTKNFDAEFLGIHPKEVELLWKLSDASLEKMHIVPIRPSVLTMPRLKRLEICVVRSGMGGGTHLSTRVQDRTFLSKVTGILAFKKMTRKGIKIRVVGHSDEVAYRLRHLRPFASVGFKNRRGIFVPLQANFFV